MSEDNIIWYLQDLINKNFDTTFPPAKDITKKQIPKIYERDFEKDNICNFNNFNFEKTLINILFNIEITLSTLLKHGGKK